MQNNRRQFYVYDLEIGARKAGATVPTMNEVLPVFEKFHAAGKTYPIRADTATMLIGDINVDVPQQFITLLVRVSDTMAPNSVYSDPAAGHFNEHVKVGAMGSDFGCHVLISTIAEQGLPNIYTCIIERVPGVSPDLIRRIFSKFLNYQYHDDAASFSYPSPAGGVNKDGQPRMDRCCPHIELRGRPSASLIDDINNGHLAGISLVKTELVTPFGGTAYLKKKSSELKLDIDHANLPAQVWDSLKTLFHAQSGDYGTAKISYKAPGNGRTVTVEIDAESGAPLKDMYVLSFDLINIFPFLAQSAISIASHLRDLAAPQLIKHRNT